MDVAGAIGTTAIFPMIIGILFLVAALVYIFGIVVGEPNMGERRVATWLSAAAGFFIIFAIVAWVVAIWLGYAQGASG